MDAAWYRETYRDVAELGMDPAEHYLQYGAELGRNPSRTFNTNLYLATYPDAARSGLNPLVHYVQRNRGQSDQTLIGQPQDSARKRVNLIRTKLLSLGFTDRPLAELEEIAAWDDDTEARALAARELALWHTRARTVADYRKALDWIGRARRDAPDLAFCASLATIELLCHFRLGNRTAGLDAYDRAALAGEVTPDVILARANYGETPEDRVVWINQVLAHYRITPVGLLPDQGSPAYDRLTCDVDLPRIVDGPTVTVVIAAYEAADVLPTALRSLQDQTWKNLEIIVLDDCSPTHQTRQVAESFAETDPRIKVVRMTRNGGAYVARNEGLDLATGDFVTIHDADDWSHPRKIETQMGFMMENRDLVGCTSQMFRVENALYSGILRGSADLVASNTSSLLFRKNVVIAHVGYWDRVRFAADGHMLQRIQRYFGKSALRRLDTGPLSFQRYTEQSITASSKFGYEGFMFGARLSYHELEALYFKDENIYYDKAGYHGNKYKLAPMRQDKDGATRHFDIMIAADFRTPSEALNETILIIQQSRRFGLRVGLIALYHYSNNPTDGIENSIAKCLKVDAVELVVYGEQVSCEILAILQPEALDPLHRLLPSVETERIDVVVFNPPETACSTGHTASLNLQECARNLTLAFGKEAIWCPVGPVARAALTENHQTVSKEIVLSKDDWSICRLGLAG